MELDGTYDPREEEAARPGPSHSRPGRSHRTCVGRRGRMRAHHAYDRRHSRRRRGPDGRSGRGSHPHPSGRSREESGRTERRRGGPAHRSGPHLSQVRDSMTNAESIFQFPPHDHLFLGEDHDKAERRTWAVIILCSVMMIAEIIGGALFGSLALIADGLHMSTHAGALLLAALAYTYARKYANDRSFTFGTGKFGDLAGYSSAIVLAMIALLIGYEAVSRLLTPVPISFNEAIPIAVLGLVVNVASAWLLSGGHHHGHGHGPSHGHDHDYHGDEHRRIELGTGAVEIEVFEDNVPPRFRVRADTGVLLAASDVTIETIRPDGGRQLFAFEDRGGYLESRDEIPEPHAFLAKFRLVQGDQHHDHELEFEEHDHDHHP